MDNDLDLPSLDPLPESEPAAGTGRTHQHQQAVIHRLARLEGHLRGVRRMVETGVPCPDILVQIAAVRAALDAAGRLILEDHIKSCLVDAVQSGSFESAYQDLERALKRFIG
jgi:DNA-binding FrmR family transcriptional regulator